MGIVWISIKMSEIHIAQVGFLQPVLSVLSAAGIIPSDKNYHKRLRRFNLDDPNNYVPITEMYL